MVDKLAKPKTISRVRDFLALIPRAGERHFYALDLLTADKKLFALSMQGSEFHQSRPRQQLNSIIEYSQVEITIIPNSDNNDLTFKRGVVFSQESGDYRIASNNLHQPLGWLRPSDIGFRMIKNNPDGDTVYTTSPNALIHDLADFFANGGLIEVEGPNNKHWIRSSEKISKSAGVIFFDIG